MNPAIKHLSRVDKVLAALIRRVGPFALTPRRKSPYQSLVEAVVYQQLSGKAASTILARVRALFPGKRFPGPADLAAMPARKLRGAGLSRAKTIALKDIATKTLTGRVPSSRRIGRMSDQEIVERLTEIQGVGPWTVEMFLMFTLGRPDVLPATDYGVRKGFALTFKRKALPSPKELLKYGERWKPHSSTAAWYLWRSLEAAVR
jgi:DNA-3-methyladenine glycosylase II